MPPPDRLDLLLRRLEEQGIRLGLEPLAALLSALGGPQGGLVAVLVAGTNGKGSTCALLDSMARAAGYRTGLYTSPHLEGVEERIRIGGRPIERHDLKGLLEEVVATAADGGLELPTYFEALTAAAFLAFRRAGVELAVLEVGLGGRLDATNLAHPTLSVVTGIAYDHEDALGRTLAQIAREKAGIFRRGRPALAWGEDADVRRELLAVAAECGASLELVDETVQDQETTANGDNGLSLRLQTPGDEYRLETPLAGAHQARNLALAVRAAEVLRVSGFERLDSAAIRRGAAAVRWPGRLERAALPSGVSVLLDAAHNPSGVAALTTHLDLLGQPFDLLFGVLADKRADAMLPPLAERARRVTLTRPPAAGARDPETLRALIRSGIAFECEPDPAKALDRALAASPDLLVCCGSIYLIGPLRTLLRERHGAPWPTP
ncbi:MAG: bifunctional folylpolyglutamate synthase/dihydrofolate synthase [Thermoanaerobaculia bacterium]